MPDNKVVFRPLREVCYLAIAGAFGMLAVVVWACVRYGPREVLEAIWR